MLRIRNDRRVSRVRHLQNRCVQAHIVRTGIRCNHCQIIRACRNIGRPLATGVAGWEVVVVHHVQKHAARNKEQNTRDSPSALEQQIATVQEREAQQNPVHPFGKHKGTVRHCHSLDW